MKVEVYPLSVKVEVPMPTEPKGELSEEQEPGEPLHIDGTRYITEYEYSVIEEMEKRQGEKVVGTTGSVLVENDPLLKMGRQFAVALAKKYNLPKKAQKMELRSLVPILREYNCKEYIG